MHNSLINRDFSPVRWMILLVVLLGIKVCPAQQSDSIGKGPSAKSSKEARLGFDLIVNKRFLPADFDQETFDLIWMSWPEELCEKARTSSIEERRSMAFARYGFTRRKDDPGKPLQYVVDKNGNWSMNCFSCHGGSLYGSAESYPGLPNNRIALETLYQDLGKIKRILKKPFSSMDLGFNLMPMGTTVGTSNAVIFGTSLMTFRDKHLNIKNVFIPPYVQHHDMDAPPWWHFKKKKMIYIDGFTERHHRALMPFIMVRQNNGPKFRQYEKDFETIQKFLFSVEPPRYPYTIDAKLAARGKTIFNNHCSRCHGTYGQSGSYPETRVDLQEIETDPVRLSALSKTYRKKYRDSWLTEYGNVATLVDPRGYVAPPLDGIWATAPYFHNGSVPTLRNVLDPKTRPVIWKRFDDQFDEKNGGLLVKQIKSIPLSIDAHQRRQYFDTRKKGKSNHGHRFGKELSVFQQDCLIEYLKML